jgi:transcriptional antiterminator NusG
MIEDTLPSAPHQAEAPAPTPAEGAVTPPAGPEPVPDHSAGAVPPDLVVGPVEGPMLSAPAGPVEAPAARAEEEAKAPPEPEPESEPEVEEQEEEAEAVAEEAAPPEEPKPSNKHWYVVKVQSGREESIRDAIERRVRKEGLEEFYGQIIIPVEKITEVTVNKQGKRVTKTKERKLYPGYLMAEVEYNDRVLYLFRETSGVGDFVGATATRAPIPMSEKEISKILRPTGDVQPGETPPPPKGLNVGDRVRVTDGTFNTMEGEVKEILQDKGQVRVELTIFGRPVKVDLEYFQIEEA